MREVIQIPKEYRGREVSRCLIGKCNGAYERELLDLDSKDLDDNLYQIMFPEEILSINPSFFIGLFQKSLERIGIEVFCIKYKFDFSNFRDKELRRIIEESIANCKRVAFYEARVQSKL